MTQSNIKTNNFITDRVIRDEVKNGIQVVKGLVRFPF